MILEAFDTDVKSLDLPWFKPLSIVTSLRTKISNLSDNPNDVARYELAHENAHYVQSISTFSGIRPFLIYWETHSAFHKYFNSNKSELESEIARNLVNEKFQTYKTEIADWTGIPFVDVDIFDKSGPLLAKLGDQAVAVFAKNLPTHKTRLFRFTRTALQESMALALEVWLGRDVSIIQQALQSNEWWQFQYGMGFEAVKIITGWEDAHSLAWVTVTCADYSLDHVLPGEVFVRAIYEISKKWPEPPGIEKLPDVYALLQEKYDTAGRLSARSNLIEVLEERAAAPTGDNKFDDALIELFRAMLFATKVREEVPFLITQKLLLDFNDPWFVEHFTFPFYFGAGQVINTGVNNQLFTSALLLEIAYHRLHTFMDEPDLSPKCPLYAHSRCDFPKSYLCSTAPWEIKRGLKTPNSICAYEYVESSYDPERYKFE